VCRQHVRLRLGTGAALLASVVSAAGAASASAASVREFPLPGASAPTDIVAGPGARLWLALPEGLGQLSTTGSFSVSRRGLSAGAVPNALAPAPGAALWFTENDAEAGGDGEGRLGRVSAAGVVSELPDDGLTPFGGLTDVVTGPNGTAAFVAAATPTIGLYTEQDGPEIVEGVPEEMNGDARSIALGPDGRTLWYTGAEDPGVIGSVTFDRRFEATFAEYPAGTADGAPEDIVLGPDGGLWFTKPNGPAISRFDPITHAVVDYSAGLPPASLPTGIAVGADGAIWFTDAGPTPAIGRLDPATGAIVLRSDGISPGAAPSRITPGPDGALWFTEPGTNSVGRADPAAFAPPPPDPGPDPVPEPPAPEPEPQPQPEPPRQPVPEAPAPQPPAPEPPAPEPPAPVVAPVPAPAPAPPPPTPSALRISGVTRSMHVRAPRRARLRVRLNAAAELRVTIARRGVATPRVAVRPGRGVAGRAGSNLLVLPRLGPGRYRITVTARADGGRTDVRHARLRVLRPAAATPSFTG
jgi:virginiamycin B lyase